MNLITTLFAAAVILKWIGYGYPATIGWFWIIGWWVVAATLAAIVKAFLDAYVEARDERRRQEEILKVIDGHK